MRNIALFYVQTNNEKQNYYFRCKYYGLFQVKPDAWEQVFTHSFCRELGTSGIPQHSRTGLTRIFCFKFQVTVTKRDRHTKSKKETGFFSSKKIEER